MQQGGRQSLCAAPSPLASLLQATPRMHLRLRQLLLAGAGRGKSLAVRLLQSSLLLSRLLQLILPCLVALQRGCQLLLQQCRLGGCCGIAASGGGLQLCHLRLQLRNQRIGGLPLLLLGSRSGLGCCSCSECAVSSRLHLLQPGRRGSGSLLCCRPCCTQLLPQAGSICLQRRKLRSCSRQLLLLPCRGGLCS